MHFQPEAVPGAVDEAVTDAAATEEIASRAVDILRDGAVPQRGPRTLVGFEHQCVALAPLRGGAAADEIRARDVRAVALPEGAKIADN